MGGKVQASLGSLKAGPGHSKSDKPECASSSGRSRPPPGARCEGYRGGGVRLGRVGGRYAVKAEGERGGVAKKAERGERGSEGAREGGQQKGWRK